MKSWTNVPEVPPRFLRGSSEVFFSFRPFCRALRPSSSLSRQGQVRRCFMQPLSSLLDCVPAPLPPLPYRLVLYVTLYTC